MKTSLTREMRRRFLQPKLMDAGTNYQELSRVRSAVSDFQNEEKVLDFLDWVFLSNLSKCLWSQSSKNFFVFVFKEMFL